MARTALTAQRVTRDGVAPTYAPASAEGHYWGNTGRQILHLKNTDAAPVEVSFPISVLVDGEAVADKTVTVAATTGDLMVGPFPPSQYRQDDGNAWVNFDSVTGLTVALLDITSAA